MKETLFRSEYLSPQTKVLFISVECSITASNPYQGAATTEAYESEDLFE